MTTIKINPEKLDALEGLTLDRSSHSSFEQGHCAMEVVSWLADEGFTDAPQCASPVLARYTIRLNDRWDTEERQTLKPYLVRMIGTGGDGKDAARGRIARRHLADRIVPWLDLAGVPTEDIQQATDDQAVIDALYAARDAAWGKRRESRAALEAKIKARLVEQGRPAAVAVAAANAVAVAVAAANAVADAVADAVAVAAAVADADWSGPWSTGYSRVYNAVRSYLREHPTPATERIAALKAKQGGAALVLLDKLIDAEEA